MVDVTSLPDIAIADLLTAEAYLWIPGSPVTDHKVPLTTLLGVVGGYNVQTGTSYQLALSDLGKLVAMNNAAPNTIEVPLNATTAFPIGTKIDIGQRGVGQTTIVPEGGVTILNTDGLVFTSQYALATIQKIGTDEWWAAGKLTT